MNIVKCDKCGKNKAEKKKWIRVSISGTILDYQSYDLCEKCGVGILSVLKKNFKENKK